MAKKREKQKLNPRHQALKDQKKMKALMIGFIATGVIIVGLIAYAVVYSVFIKENIAVATVNGENIDNEYFKARVRLERNGYIQQYMLLNAQAQIFAEDPNQSGYYQEQMAQVSSVLDSVAMFGELVLNNMIEDEIIAIKGREMGIEVTEADIDAFIGQIFNYYPQGTPTPAPTQAPFVAPPLSPTQEAILQLEPTTVVDSLDIDPSGGVAGIGTQPTATLAAPTRTPGATATPFTEDMFRSEYDSYLADLSAINVSEEHLRTYLYYYLTRTKVQEAIFGEIQAEQEQIWARHILVPTQAEGLIVLDRLESGEKWADVAADVSLDTSNKDNGGDLGWFSAGQMVPRFNDAAFALEIGDISEPVETQFGWHIIQIVDKAVLPLVPSDLQYKQTTAYQQWLAEAMDSVPFEINEVYRDIAPADPSIVDFIAAQAEAAEETVEE